MHRPVRLRRRVSRPAGAALAAVLIALLTAVAGRGQDVSRSQDRLETAMEQKARQEAAGTFTDVELVERGSVNVESQTATRLVMNATYYVYLRGNLIGRNRYVVAVRVRGQLTEEGGSFTPTVLGSTVLSKTKR